MLLFGRLFERLPTIRWGADEGTRGDVVQSTASPRGAVVVDDDDCPIPVPLPADDKVWPDDPDEVPEWVLRAEALRERVGIVPIRVPARTRREHEEKDKLCDERLRQRGIVSCIDDEIRLMPALPPDLAARDFVTDLRVTGRIGRYTSDELTDAYLTHCAENRRAPTTENLVRRELKKLAGVTCEQIEAGKVHGRRQRIRVWIIEDGVESDIAPDVDDASTMEIEPLRMAA